MCPLQPALSLRRALIFLLICLFLLPSAAFARRHVRRHVSPTSANKGDLQHRQLILQLKIRQTQLKLHQVKRQENKSRVQLHEVEQRLDVARGQLQFAQLKFLRSKIELHRADRALNEARAQFATAQFNAGTRLRGIYERGQQGYLELMISAGDFGTLLQRVELARLLRDQDRAALLDLKAHKEKLYSIESQKKEKTSEVKRWEQQVAVFKKRTAQERIAKANEFSEVHKEREDITSELDALERDSADVTSMLRQMQSSPAGVKRYNARYVGKLGLLPVNGRITSPFGYRYHPILHTRRLHTGVDIAAPIGTPIVAAGGGYVVSAGRRGGYGNAVIIDHGGGMATLYGHMSGFVVHAGETVSRGQLIGYVGSTGISTGPHCHFELRRNGVPINPL